MPNNADTVWSDIEDAMLTDMATRLGVTEDVQLFLGDDVAAAGMSNVLMFAIGLDGGPDQLQNFGSTEGGHGSFSANARLSGLFDKRRDATNLCSKVLTKSPFVSVASVQVLGVTNFPVVRTVLLEVEGKRHLAYELIIDFLIAFDVTES